MATSSFRLALTRAFSRENRRAVIRKGRLETLPFASKIFGNTRRLTIYLPAGYDDHPQQRYPVLYMHDGQNLFDAKTAAYGAAWEIGATMDRLIASGAIEPVIVVGIDNNQDRMPEYTPCCDTRYGGGKIDGYMA